MRNALTLGKSNSGERQSSNLSIFHGTPDFPLPPSPTLRLRALEPAEQVVCTVERSRPVDQDHEGPDSHRRGMGLVGAAAEEPLPGAKEMNDQQARNLDTRNTPAEHNADEPKVGWYAVQLCEACIDGIGQCCHTPGCAMIRHPVDIPFNREELIPIRPVWERIAANMEKVGTFEVMALDARKEKVKL